MPVRASRRLVRLLSSGRVHVGRRRQAGRRGPRSLQWFPFFSVYVTLKNSDYQTELEGNDRVQKELLIHQ
ncbi:hypothetical protein Taro_006304 [Colocasia esculenta]|uniref:Uncharacterized protein n=1 Tax=Colocasia esculenta TaxID=4460 RepID=A0A843TUZ5_COLES|nr:hypothetical protein [Colocasia esculenta]